MRVASCVLALVLVHQARPTHGQGPAPVPVDVEGCAKTDKTAADADCQGFDCLQKYVDKEDGAFEWEDTGARLHGKNLLGTVTWTGYVLNVTSQRWLNESDFNFSWCGGRPIGHVWFHQLIVVVPSNLRVKDHAVMYMTGGNNENVNDVPKADDEDVAVVASLSMNSRTIGAALFQIPNQHVVFSADAKQQHRSEDAVIAFTWQMYVEDPTRTEWPLRLPMTKAGVKAMDAITQFADKTLGFAPSKFGVAGASKRGWTTWTLASVDPRVVAAIPIVMDELNFIPNIHHHYKSYGGWSFALKDYTDLNFTRCLDHPNTLSLMKIVDPYWYSDRLTMPKMIVNSGMDEFFLPDDTRWWWDDMAGEKHFLMVPNAEHSEATGVLELLPAITTFYNAVANHRVRPEFDWVISPSGNEIAVNIKTTPPGYKLKGVHMWHATTCNSERRDFRIVSNGWGPDKKCLPCGIKIQGLCANLEVLWASEKLEPTKAGAGSFLAHRDVPSGGRWTAFFVDVAFEPILAATNRTVGQPTPPLTWPLLAEGDFEFTSEVSVIPREYPFSDCHGANCSGTLV